MNSNPQLLSPDQAALRLRVATNTLAKWRVSGEGPDFVKIGSRVFYEQGDLFDWIEGQKRSNTSASCRGG
ncbi:MAG: excisionase [Maricaulis sp.]|nr:excisionase [Maricaulis sp.]